LEEVVIELGYKPVRMASTKSKALSLGVNADVALIDVDLLDGPTGPEIGWGCPMIGPSTGAARLAEEYARLGGNL
jgi:hypothetical protein